MRRLAGHGWRGRFLFGYNHHPDGGIAMGGGTVFGVSKFTKTRGFTFAIIFLAALAGGCSKSEPDTKADNGVLDTSRLPRLSGAKEVFASPASTMFTSTEPVPQAADAVDKALAAAGWDRTRCRWRLFQTADRS